MLASKPHTAPGAVRRGKDREVAGTQQNRDTLRGRLTYIEVGLKLMIFRAHRGSHARLDALLAGQDDLNIRPLAMIFRMPLGRRLGLHHAEGAEPRRIVGLEAAILSGTEGGQRTGLAAQ